MSPTLSQLVVMNAYFTDTGSNSYDECLFHRHCLSQLYTANVALLQRGK